MLIFFYRPRELMITNFIDGGNELFMTLCHFLCQKWSDFDAKKLVLMITKKCLFLYFFLVF